MAKHTPIPLSLHECSGDRSLKLTETSVPMSMVGHEVYRARDGFVATLPDGLCLSGYFATENEARAAIARARGDG